MRDEVRYLPYSQALTARDALPRLQAHALSTLVSFVPASIAVFHRICPRGRAREAVGVQTARPDLSLPDAWRNYVEGEQHHDPFVTSPAAQSGAAVLSLADVCPPSGPQETPYGRHLKELRMSDRVTVYLREAGTTIGLVSLLRSTDEPPFTPREIAALRRLQPLLEQAYVCARRAAGDEPARDVVLELGLTPREADVAALVGRGATNAEIARTLHVTEATVKTHLTRIFAKVGVRSRTQLALTLGQGGVPRSSERAFARG
jgi:DNA-binding CsgD family transcriptional regulator